MSYVVGKSPSLVLFAVTLLTDSAKTRVVVYMRKDGGFARAVPRRRCDSSGEATQFLSPSRVAAGGRDAGRLRCGAAYGASCERFLIRALGLRRHQGR